MGPGVRGHGRAGHRGAGHRSRQRARFQARVEHVADAVAKQVDAHHQREDHRAGNDRDVRRGEENLAPFAEHGAKVRLRRLGAQSQERQAGGFEDHPADRGRHGDDDDRQHVWQDFDEEDLRVRLAGEPGGVDEFAPRKAARDAADIAREERNVDDGDGVEGVQQPRPEHGHDRQRQQDVGKRHDHVDAAHHQAVDAPAGVAGNQPDQRAEEGCDQRRRDADEQADPRAPDEAREDVAAKRVGSQEMARGERPDEAIGGRRDEGIGERQQRRGEGDDHDNAEHDEPGCRQRIVEEQTDGVGTPGRPAALGSCGDRGFGHQRSLGSSTVCTTSAARLKRT